ncbi:MAG: fibronectin type III domain-containing protein [Methanomassiliicoccales archaeon]|nr:MAG: fibronectin type III domain-containing protein [Methanomassiliicoccales archaeon]
MNESFRIKRILLLATVGMLLLILFPDLGFIQEHSNVVSANDLIIGDDSPNEKLLIENTYHHYGNVYLTNQGEIEVKNGEFRVYGNIWAFHESKIIVNSSTFGFLSVTKWQFSINLFNTSELRVENSNIYSNLFPNLINPNNDSKISFINVTFTDWFSCKMADNSSVEVKDSYGPKGWASEFFFMDSAQGNFSNIDGIINVFTVFHDGSVIDYSPLWNEYVFHFEFPADVPFASGIDYSFIIDDCYIYGNSPLLEKGCDVTVRNCITSVIIRPINDDSLNISGLVANTYQSDWNAPLSDRQFRAVNSILRNWHLHMFDYSSVNLVNSIFSEILSIYWNCSLYMRNTIYKGDAGPFWVFGESTVFARECVFFAQDPWGLNPVVYVKDLGTLALYNCYVYTDFTMEDYATVYLLNSETFREPMLLDASELWVAKINSPPTGLSNDSVPISGSAYIDTAPASNISFGSYQLSYAGPPDYDVYTPIGPERTEPVKDGILESWNTSTLTPAIYYLRLDMKDINLTDNVSVYWVINIQRSDVLHYPPSEPQALLAIENNNNVELNWNPPLDNGNASITGYTIYRGLSMGSLSPVAEVGNQTQFIDGNVTPGTTYFYRISATNKMGEGPLSELEIISMNPLMDLILTTSDISFSSSTPMEGQMITIYGDIKAQNLTQSELVWVKMEIDGVSVDVKPVTISGSSTQVQFNWTAEEGNHDISLDVDIVNSVDESHEDNNVATKQISVSESSKPDLVIESNSIEFSNNAPLEYDVVMINATIFAYNLSEDLFVVVDLLVDDEQKAYITRKISSTDTLVQFNWTTQKGDHDITIAVDSINSITESNEGNNRATRKLTVLQKSEPDLSISGMYIVQSVFNESEVIDIGATITAVNLTGEIQLTVEFYVDDVLESEKSITVANGANDIQFKWTVSEGGHNFKIKIDTTNIVVESDESNNIALKDIYVSIQTEKPKEKEEDWSFPWAILIVGLLFLVLAPFIGLIMGTRGRRKNSQKKESYK